jgi:mitochondrial enoyl-[acyl-carrier protein] reductase / trans-2-enoyl-CoA reductase
MSQTCKVFVGSLIASSRVVPNLTLLVMLRRPWSIVRSPSTASLLFGRRRWPDSFSAYACCSVKDPQHGPDHHRQQQRPRWDSYHSLSFREHSGEADPLTVLEYQQQKTFPHNTDINSSDIEADATVVEMLAAPWNPADAMVVAGTYPKLRSADDDAVVPDNADERMIAGSEGWGRVIRVGANDFPYLSVGDYVVPGRPGLGTMQSHCTASKKDRWIKLDRGMQLFEKCGNFAPAALFQTGGTAYRMLHDPVEHLIRPGDTIVQNAGNSAVGYMIGQLATHLFGARAVSLVRRGNRTEEQCEQLVDELRTHGQNELVVFEDDLPEDNGSNPNTKSALRVLLTEHGLKRPKLALNAVGGRSAQHLISCLVEGGVMVTYGGMSRKPFGAAAPLIFRDIKLVGYWHSRWMTRASVQQRRRLINDLVEMVVNHNVTPPPIKVFPLASFAEALQWDQSGEAIRRKVVFDCREE